MSAAPSKPHPALCALVVAFATTSVACSMAKAGPGRNRGDGGAATELMDTTDGGLRAAFDAGPRQLDDDAAPLGRTEELNARARHLLEAIVQDSPQLATDIELPRDVFVSCRDTMDPTRSWERNVSSGFNRAIHLLHKRLKVTERAQFVSLELGRSVTQVIPKKKEWTKPLWKVRHSRVTFTVDGKIQRLEIPEMISWRGAWYVSKLR